MPTTKLIVIFSFSLIVALTGALVPGPLLTYTIIKTVETKRRGFLIGEWVILGHGLIEAVIIIGILLGFSVLLKNPLVIKIIGSLGGIFLLYMGIDIIRKVIRNPQEKQLPNNSNSSFHSKEKQILKISNPVIGGALVSMSNPYWWIWWATVGFGFILQYQISFTNWPALLAFFVGHEIGDLSWYATVSTLFFFGRKKINGKIYTLILVLCSVVIIGFGAYLGTASFFKS